VIRESFARQVRAVPHGVAVRHGDAVLTYADLNRAANQLAHHLGVSRGTVVGVCLDRGLDLVVALLAVLKSGAAHLWLEPHEVHRAPAHQVLVTTSALARGLPGPERLLCLDRERPLIERRSPLNPVVPAHTADPASVLDGVVVSHRTITSQARTAPLAPGDVVAHRSPASSPSAALELWIPLCRGATVLLDRETGRVRFDETQHPQGLPLDLAAQRGRDRGERLENQGGRAA
jgi:non-ribosomal peptide synthetase component F